VARSGRSGRGGRRRRLRGRDVTFTDIYLLFMPILQYFFFPVFPIPFLPFFYQLLEEINMGLSVPLIF
jgi:hypothetical protein